MSTPVDPVALKKLETEALACERQNDFVGALDIYEEIERNGWSSPRHLMALGECYMRARQRQNAREAWVRAFEADPKLNDVVQLLDRYFPGWEKTATHHKSDEAPPPPPAFSETQAGLTMDAVSFRTPPAPARAVPPPEPPPRKQAPYVPKPSPADATQLSSAPPRQVPQPMAPAPQQIRMAPAQVIIEAAKVVVGEGGSRESKVNWAYIMADVTEEASKQRRLNAPRSATPNP